MSKEFKGNKQENPKVKTLLDDLLDEQNQNQLGWETVTEFNSEREVRKRDESWIQKHLNKRNNGKK